MPTCADDGYPMVPVGESGGQMKWGCSNLWHPHRPGSCPNCGHAGRPRSSLRQASDHARCAKCGHEWMPALPAGDLRRDVEHEIGADFDI